MGEGVGLWVGGAAVSTGGGAGGGGGGTVSLCLITKVIHTLILAILVNPLPYPRVW